MRALLILALLATTAFTAACQSTTSPSPSVKRTTIYGQPCNTRSREAGLCRTVPPQPPLIPLKSLLPSRFVDRALL